MSGVKQATGEPPLAPDPVSSVPASLPPVGLPVPVLSVPPAALISKQPLVLDSSIGCLDLRSAVEENEFQQCEAIIREERAQFVRVGEALARIRDNQLYKNEYHSFEVYCRERWGFGHTQVWRYIAAAEVHKSLSAIPGIPTPESEAQARPLTRLPAELVQQAWLNALSWSGDSHVPVQLIKRAVKQALKAERPNLAAEPVNRRQQRRRVRESVRSGFRELLTLLLQSAERDVVIAKVQELERLLEPLLSSRKTRA
jgi:hypothetical protein